MFDGVTLLFGDSADDVVLFAVGESSPKLPLFGDVFRKLVSRPAAPSAFSGSSSDSHDKNA